MPVRFASGTRRAGCRVTVALGLVLIVTAPAPARAADENPIRVRVEGLGGAPGRNVLATLGIALASRSGKYSEAEVRALHARAPGEIRRALEPFGYYRASVEDTLVRGRGSWNATYRVDPGATVRLDTVDVRALGSGADDPGFAAAVRDFPLRVGQPFLHAEYELGKKAFLDAAASTGYLDGDFTRSKVVVDLRSYAARIDLAFDTGPRYRFGAVTFEQQVLDPEILRGFVTFGPGQPFDARRLLELQRALSGTPYFERVEVGPRLDSAAIASREVPVVAQLWPSRRIAYTAGAGYGTDDGIRARLGLEFRRLNRHGHRAQTEGKISEIERSVTGQYVIPWPRPRQDLFAISAGYADLDPTTSDSRTSRAGVSVDLGRGRWRESFALAWERARFSVGLDGGLSTLLMPEASWTSVVADDRLDPRHGRRILFRVRGASERAGSDASFAQVETGGRWVEGAGARGRVLMRVQAGYTRTGSFRRLPPDIRFFAGGAQSIRAYGYQELGARDDAGNVIGGETLAVASLEYEWRFLERWGAAAFFDAGNAMRSPRDRLKSGAGAGLRWLSPVGMVRVDAAWPLSDPGDPVHFHLSIGPDL